MNTKLPTIAHNADIRFLGTLLGNVIRKHGGEPLFERIEAMNSS